MSSICQASPCTPLTNATGDTKYYKPGEGWFQQVVSTQNGTREEKLTYCPFCGTHLLEVTAPSIVRRVDRSAPAYVPASKYFGTPPARPALPKPQLRSVPSTPPPVPPRKVAPPAMTPVRTAVAMAAELTSTAPIHLLPLPGSTVQAVPPKKVSLPAAPSAAPPTQTHRPSIKDLPLPPPAPPMSHQPRG